MRERTKQEHRSSSERIASRRNNVQKRRLILNVTGEKATANLITTVLVPGTIIKKTEPGSFIHRCKLVLHGTVQPQSIDSINTKIINETMIKLFIFGFMPCQEHQKLNKTKMSKLTFAVLTNPQSQSLPAGTAFRALPRLSRLHARHSSQTSRFRPLPRPRRLRGCGSFL